MNPITQWTIYVLKNPRTDEVRYVGWTSRSVKTRLKAHLDEAVRVGRRRGSHKNRWVLSLLSIGLKPKLEVIETGSGPEWGEAERRWIATFRAANANLLNRSDGGEGNPGCLFSEEARKKISETAKSWKRSPEHMAKWSEAARKANTGRKRNPKAVEASAAKLRGIPRPPEVIAKWHAKSKGRTVSAATRAKLSEWHKGRKASPETRAKMSEAHRKRYAARVIPFPEPDTLCRFPSAAEFRKYTNRNTFGRIKKLFPPDFDFFKSGLRFDQWERAA